MAHRQICAILLGMLFMSLACAAPDASPRYGLSIRAGLALDEALQELARQTGIQVVFSNIVPDPADPAKLVVTTSHPTPYTRRVTVYVPKQYVPGSISPFIVGADGPDRLLFAALDTLIGQHKVPVMIAISIGNGVNAVLNTTQCPESMPSLSKTKFCLWSKPKLT